MIAEKRARFGLPEILFNLFPGMGAYHFLARRVGMKRVEEIMTSGNVYTAEEMHAMGVVDVLSEDGGGEKAVYEFIRNHSRRNKARQGIAKVRHGVFRVAKEELERAADIWVDTALSLDDTDLRIMERLVRAQMAKENGGPQLRADGGSGS
jgi:DSF synthase